MGLSPGNYTVFEPVQPSGYFDGQEARGNLLLPGSIGTDLIANVALAIGGLATQNNFGEVPEVDPQGYVYIDANSNGVRDPGEFGIGGVSITLTGVGPDVFGNAVNPQTAFSDANGFYQFANLAPGHFTITETQPAGFQDGQEQNSAPPASLVNNDQFVDIDLTNDVFGGDFNFGELSPTGSLAGSVYVDQNNNGRRDPNELGLAGVLVTVIDQNNPSTRVDVVTDGNGDFRFVKMFPGTYRLEQTQPVNFVDGRETAGTAGGVVGNDVFSNITLGVSEAASGYLFGELGVRPDRVSKREFLTSTNPGSDYTGRPGSGLAAVGVPLADPSGFVYVDRDGNGQRNTVEPGIAEVRIELDGTTDSGQTIRQHVMTDAYGFYQFAFLPPGTYSLTQFPPVGYLDGAVTVGSHGGVAGESRITGIVLAAGEIGINYNFGERLPDLNSGDIDGDDIVQAQDVDAFCRAVLTKNPWYDVNDDRQINSDDLLYFVQEVLNTSPGDADLNGRFDSTDLLVAFAAGEYEDEVSGNSTWSSGDWDCDGEFTTSDLVSALRYGSYSTAVGSNTAVNVAVDPRVDAGRLVDEAFADYDLLQ